MALRSDKDFLRAALLSLSLGVGKAGQPRRAPNMAMKTCGARVLSPPASTLLSASNGARELEIGPAQGGGLRREGIT